MDFLLLLTFSDYCRRLSFMTVQRTLFLSKEVAFVDYVRARALVLCQMEKDMPN